MKLDFGLLDGVCDVDLDALDCQAAAGSAATDDGRPDLIEPEKRFVTLRVPAARGGSEMKPPAPLCGASTRFAGLCPANPAPVATRAAEAGGDLVHPGSDNGRSGAP